MTSPITRCNHCQNVILRDLEKCPECARTTRQGWRNLLLKLVVFTVFLIAMAFAGYTLRQSRMGT